MGAPASQHTVLGRSGPAFDYGFRQAKTATEQFGTSCKWRMPCTSDRLIVGPLSCHNFFADAPNGHGNGRGRTKYFLARLISRRHTMMKRHF